MRLKVDTSAGNVRKVRGPNDSPIWNPDSLRSVDPWDSLLYDSAFAYHKAWLTSWLLVWDLRC